MTAWRMLITRAKVRPGEDVLILGAGSGVSTAAIQVAKLAGCTVFTTSSSDAKLEKAKALGADVLVNYKAMPWSKAIWELTGKRGVDVVVDHVGQATFKDSVRSLREGRPLDRFAGLNREPRGSSRGTSRGTRDRTRSAHRVWPARR